MVEPDAGGAGSSGDAPRSRPPRGAPGGGEAVDAVYGDGEPFQQRDQGPILHRAFPVTARLPGYAQRSLRRDAVAGVTVAALALPSGMAYAQLAGLSPVAGLYALLLPALAYALFATSRQLIVGPEGSLAVLVATAVTPLADGDANDAAALAAMLAILVGGIAVVGRIVRLGWIADYFSLAVLVGYLHGVAFVLVAGQLGKLFGLSIGADEALPQVREFVEEVDGAHGLTVAIGVVSLAALFLLRLLLPRLPGALIVVVGGIAASAAFDLAGQGVAVVGDIPAGLPSLGWPGVGASDAVALLPAALGIFAVGYADAILTARSFAGRHGQHVDANQELIAFGSANVAAGVSQGFPVGGSGSRTAVADQMGGRTQIVGAIAAVVIAVVLLFLTAPVEKLPTACLGAVIVSAAVGLVDPASWRALARAGRSQLVIAAVTTVSVITLGVLRALSLAVALSVIDVVSRRARPHDAVLGWVQRLDRYADVSLHPSARVTPSVVVYRLDGALLFVNVSYFKARVREAIVAAGTPTRYLVLSAEGINGIDASGADAALALVESLRAGGITLVVARLKGQVRQQFDDVRLTEAIGADNFFDTVSAAVRECATRLSAPDAHGGTQ